ncbi:MAG: hypothetical protein QXG48_06085 [Thermofilaceae archaeon]
MAQAQIQTPTPVAAAPATGGVSASSAPPAAGPAAGESETGRGLTIENGWVLIWKRDTWGRFGQHSNIYTFYIDLQKLEQKALFEVLPVVRHENRDSSRNIHRKTWARVEDIMTLNGILKVVYDAASSKNRYISVEYYLLPDLSPLAFESGLRDAKGFYDLVTLPDGRRIKVRKEGVEYE